MIMNIVSDKNVIPQKNVFVKRISIVFGIRSPPHIHVKQILCVTNAHLKTNGVKEILSKEVIIILVKSKQKIVWLLVLVVTQFVEQMKYV